MTKEYDSLFNVSNLLPCPFCGATTDELCGVEYGCEPEQSKYFIRCVKCSVKIVQDRPDKVEGMWNSRASNNC